MTRIATITAVLLSCAAIWNLSNARSNERASGVPTIEGHGSVKAFPDAKAQPRDGSKIVVDLTAGAPQDKLAPGVEKLARYVNIYASAGKTPARARIVVILHGDATVFALSDKDYAAAFKTADNPNLPLIRQLRHAGVEFLVCGQSLTKKGYTPEQTAPEVDLAVSGLTALVNHQHDGFAYMPLH